MKVLAIIPARGGSKGIPRKNLTLIEGRPLIYYSITHAVQSSLIDRVIVSTDDQEIASIAEECGAEVPFLRPAELAEDHVLDFPVFKHALDFLESSENYLPDIIVHLRPTSPIRKPVWIDDAVRILLKTPEADSVRSVSLCEMHPYRMFDIDSDGFLKPLMSHEHPEPYLLRRQDLPPLYHYNCVIDVTRVSTLREQNSMTGGKMLPYYMSPDDVFDIDTPRDLEIIRLFARQYL